MLYHHLHCPILNSRPVTVGQIKVLPGCKKDKYPRYSGISSQSVFFTWPWQFVSLDFIANKIGPEGFPGGAVDQSLPDNAGDTGSIPGLGGSHMPWSN